MCFNLRLSRFGCLSTFTTLCAFSFFPARAILVTLSCLFLALGSVGHDFFLCVLVVLLESLKMPIRGSPCARLCLSGVFILPRLLEDFEMPVLSSPRARRFVPWAPVGPRPLEDFEVPILGSTRARRFV